MKGHCANCVWCPAGPLIQASPSVDIHAATMGFGSGFIGLGASSGIPRACLIMPSMGPLKRWPRGVAGQWLVFITGAKGPTSSMPLLASLTRIWDYLRAARMVRAQKIIINLPSIQLPHELVTNIDKFIII